MIVLAGGYTWTLPLALACLTLGLGVAGALLLHNADPERWASAAANAVRSNVEPAVVTTADEAALPPPVNGVVPSTSTAANALDGDSLDETDRAHPAIKLAMGATAAAPSGANASASRAAVTPNPTSPLQATDATQPASGKATAGKVTTGQITVSGRLPAESIRKVVGGANGRFRMCYERGLQKVPTLGGRISVRFVIGRDGSVSNASLGDSDLPDADVKSCVVRSFYGLKFTPPEAGIVTVTYPLRFRAA